MPINQLSQMPTFRWEIIIKEMNANFDLDDVLFDLHGNKLECKICESLLSANPSHMLNSFFTSLVKGQWSGGASVVPTINAIEINMIENTPIPNIVTTVVLQNCHAVKYTADYDVYGVQPTIHKLEFCFAKYTMTHFDQKQKSDPVADYDRAMGIVSPRGRSSMT